MTTLGFNGGSQSSAATATPAQSGRNWLEMASNRNDPMMAFLWDIDFVFPTGLNGASLPVEMVEDIQLPLSRFDVDNVFYQGQRFYFAKFEEYSPVTMKFYEDVKGTTTLFFQQWKQLIRDNSGNYGLPADYQGRAHVYPLDQQNNYILDIELVGFFPMSFGNFAFTSAAGRQEISIEFQISSININFSDATVNTLLGLDGGGVLI